MKTKDFFRSQTFRCLIVLLCIALLAGGLLAILNDVLAVSDTERTQRAIKSIYGKSMEFEDIKINDEDATNVYGNVKNVFLLADGNYLIKAEGINGYKNGTVTVWAVMEFKSNQFLGIKKIVMESYVKQTLMSGFDQNYYAVYWSNNTAVLEGKFFEKTGENGIKNVKSGATFSSNALNNAVNSALTYTRTVLVNVG